LRSTIARKANPHARLLWDTLGAAVTFYAGAVFSLLAFMMLVLRKPDQKSHWA